MATSNATNTPITITYNGKLLNNWKDLSITRSCQSVPSTCEMTVTTTYPNTQPILYFANDFVIIKAGNQTVFTGFVDTDGVSVSKDNHEIKLAMRSKLADFVDGSNLLLTNTIQAPNIAAFAQQLLDKHNSMVMKDAYKIKLVDKTGEAGVPIPVVPIQQTSTGYELVEYYARYAQRITYDNEDGDLVLATSGKERAGGSVNLGGNVQALTFNTDTKNRFTHYYAVWSDVQQWQDKGLQPPNITGQATDPQMLASGRFRPLVFIANQFDYNTGQDLAQKRALWEAKSRYGRSITLTVTVDTWLDSNNKLFQVNTLIKSQIFPILGTSSTVTDWIIASVTYSKSITTGTTCTLQLMPPDAFAPEPIGLNNPYRDAIGGNTGNSGGAPAKPEPGSATASASATAQVGGAINTPPTAYTGF